MQGVDQHKEMVNVTGRNEGGGARWVFEEMCVQPKVVLYGEMGKSLCRNVFQPFLETDLPVQHLTEKKFCHSFGVASAESSSSDI